MSIPRPSRLSPRRMTRILVVDDHPMIRERLAEVIQREPDLTVCAEAEDRQRALELVEVSKPDLAIIDLTLKNSYGLDLIKDLRARYQELSILVISMHDESLHAERVIRAGARGYITKQEATRKILQAIRTVLNGDIYLSEKMAQRLAALAASHPRAQPGLPVNQLTDNELRVFELLGQGFGTRQIATKLGVHMRTVETYRARIKEKLHLRNAGELLSYAIHWIQYDQARL
jgi:DNA-binding NarL/FixJ family response regulator